MYDWLSPAMFPGADEKVLPVFRFPQTGGMCGGRADRNTEVQYKVVNRCAAVCFFLFRALGSFIHGSV